MANNKGWKNNPSDRSGYRHGLSARGIKNAPSKEAAMNKAVKRPVIKSMGRIKGWTRIKDGVQTTPPTIRWRNGSERDYTEITLYERLLGGFGTGLKSDGYEVLVNKWGGEKGHERVMFNGADRKRFATKKQALDFAMAYMRSH